MVNPLHVIRLRRIRPVRLSLHRPVSVIFTTHSGEVIRGFSSEDPQQGVYSGGFIIEEEGVNHD